MIEINICRQAGWLLLRFLVNYSAKSRIHICFNLYSLYKNVPSQAGIEWNGCVEKCSLCLRRVVYWNARRASTNRQLYSPGSGCILNLSFFMKRFLCKKKVERKDKLVASRDYSLSRVKRCLCLSLLLKALRLNWRSVMVFIMVWPLPMTFKLSIMIIVEPVSQKLATKHDRFK